MQLAQQDVAEHFNIHELIILDTGLTFTLIQDKDRLAGLTIADDPIKMKTNGGHCTLIYTGRIPEMK